MAALTLKKGGAGREPYPLGGLRLGLREVLLRGLGGLGRDAPGRVLRLCDAGEVGAQEGAQALRVDAQLLGECLRRDDVGHVNHLLSIRCHAHILMGICYEYMMRMFALCKYLPTFATRKLMRSESPSYPFQHTYLPPPRGTYGVFQLEWPKIRLDPTFSSHFQPSTGNY